MVLDEDTFGEERRRIVVDIWRIVVYQTTRLLVCIETLQFSNKSKVRERGQNSEGEIKEIHSSGYDDNFTTEERDENPIPTSINKLSRLDL